MTNSILNENQNKEVLMGKNIFVEPVFDSNKYEYVKLGKENIKTIMTGIVIQKGSDVVLDKLEVGTKIRFFKKEYTEKIKSKDRFCFLITENDVVSIFK